MASRETTRSRELKLRILSACVLVPFGLAAVSYGQWPLACAAAIFALIMGLEWSRMAGLSPGWLIGCLAVIPSLATLVALPVHVVWTLPAVALAGAALTLGPGRDRGVAAFGAIYTALPSLALILLRDSPGGLVLTLSLMVFVWITDISAFFGGRRFAGPLLSPRESPNKRWSGALAAFTMTMLAGAGFALATDRAVVPWVVAALSVSVASQLGDLLESRFKRAFGVKDAGSIIPGHGGLLDRVDGFGAALAYALLIMSLAPQARVILGLVA